jgi:hypothetical protein
MKDITINEDNKSNLYNNTVGDWMSKNYLFNVEPISNEEEEIKNKLLEIITFLNEL